MKLPILLLFLIPMTAQAQKNEKDSVSFGEFVLSGSSWVSMRVGTPFSGNSIQMYMNDSSIEIHGDTVAAIRYLMLLYSRETDRLYRERDSLIQRYYKRQSALIDFLNNLPDVWRSKDGNCKWPALWKLLKQDGLYEGKTGKKSPCNEPRPSPRPQATTDTLPAPIKIYLLPNEPQLDIGINPMQYSNDNHKRIPLKSMIAPAVCMFVAGAADGLNQAISFHYDRVDAKLHLKDTWANPSISWTRKYKNGDPQQGRRYIGSRTWLVWTTDLYHLTRFGSNLFTAGAITLHFSKKKKWYAYIIEGATYWLCNRVGFSLVYDRF